MSIPLKADITLNDLINSLFEDDKIARREPLFTKGNYKRIDKGDFTTIVIEAPGLKKEDINISVTRELGKDILTVKGQTELVILDEKIKKSIDNRIELPFIDAAAATVLLEDGMLFITLPFAKVNSNKIDIKF